MDDEMWQGGDSLKLLFGISWCGSKYENLLCYLKQLFVGGHPRNLPCQLGSLTVFVGKLCSFKIFLGWWRRKVCPALPLELQEWDLQSLQGTMELGWQVGDITRFHRDIYKICFLDVFLNSSLCTTSSTISKPLCSETRMSEKQGF